MNLSKISLVNQSGIADNQINLAGAEILSLDGTKIELLLSEKQRVRAIELSGQPGGDKSPLFLDVIGGAIRDRAQNFNLNAFGIPVIENADTVPPELISASLDFNNGVLTLNASEWIDATPTSLLKLDLMFIANNTYEKGIMILNGVIDSVDGYEINITLTEAQRAKSLIMSGTRGGDGGALFLRVLSGAFQDIAQNPSIKISWKFRKLKTIFDLV